MAAIRTPKGIRAFQRRLVCWHCENRRDFPWRKTQDPYSILVAEMMLQQTATPTVVPVYNTFTDAFPTAERLAAARVRDVAQILAPLGLHYRAERLVMLARDLVRYHRGCVPESEDRLLELPGVGRYIARSVCAAAFGQRKGVLDTNVLRILERYFLIRSSRPRGRDDAALWGLVDRMVPPRTLARPHEWNWALLDFAALVCRHRNAGCDECPLPACRSRCSLNSVQ